MDNAHHVHFYRRIQPKLLGDPRHFAGRQHDAKAQQEVVLEGEQSQEEQHCLEESRQAQGEDLLAPLGETVCVAPGDTEQVQAAHRHLDE